MRKYKDFESEKKIYIGKVLEHIHYKKLHSRIYEEFSSHMDDMYEDFSTGCDDEIEVTKKVLDEMGSPYTLGKELKKANKAKLFWVRVFKIACAIFTLPILYLSIVVISYIGAEISHYFNAYDIEKMEQCIIEEYNDGEPIKLLTEVEKDGILFKIYLPQKQDEDDFEVYYTKSIKVFGISIKDRFGGRGEDSDVVALITPNIDTTEYDYLYIYSKPSDTKYIKIYYEPFLDNDVEPYWSDFIEIPQGATIDNPKFILLKCPEKYKWGVYKRYDENKELID